MINTDMRLYDFYTIGDRNEYGQRTLTEEPKGQIKMVVNISSQTTQDNILYKDCSYIGLTMDKNINDTYVIRYGKNKLKVLYVNPMGRYKQVFMKEM
jgi:hypothetical protein